jgi:hypothetical protein
MPQVASRKKRTPPELAKQWGIDVKKVLHWVKTGELRAINAAADQSGRPRYLIDVADIAAFETARTVQPPTPRIRRRRTDPGVTQFF